MSKKCDFTSRKLISRENKKICKISIFFKILAEYFSFLSKNTFSTCKTRFFNKIHESAHFRAETEKKAKNDHFGPEISGDCEMKKKKLNFYLNIDDS